MHIKTVILLGIFFSFGLRDVVNLSTTFFIQGFFTFLIFFIKNAVLMFFILRVNVFFTSMHTYIHVHTNIAYYICVHEYIHAFIHSYIYRNIQYIHSHMHTFMHAYMHESIHPLLHGLSAGRCPKSPLFLTRWVSRLLGLALVSWALTHVAVQLPNTFPLAFHVSVFLHSLFFPCHWISIFYFSRLRYFHPPNPFPLPFLCSFFPPFPFFPRLWFFIFFFSGGGFFPPRGGGGETPPTN